MHRFGRRFFLRGGALSAAAFGLSSLPGFARRALAEPEQRRKTLVFLFLTGGLDGLSALVPRDEPGLRDARPALLADELVPLESGLALHPSLQPLVQLYKDGQLAFVHAAGQPHPTRSHFDAQDFLELGTPGDKSTRDGWLSRALQLSGARTPLEAVAVSTHLPRSLQGGAKAFAFASLGAVRLRPLAGGPGGEKGRSLARETFEALYQGSPDAAIAPAGKEAFEALALLERKLGRELQSRDRAGYPRGPAGASLRQLALLIKADVGLRVGCAAVGGWDTHANQPGELTRRLLDLSSAIAAFWADLGDRRDDVLLVAASEFGRTVRQNGALGTDHGHGGLAFVLGGRVAGGKVYGRWPGLGRDQLYEGRDLEVTTDLRAILATAAEAQLGVSDTSRLFPNWGGANLRFIKS